MTHNGHSARFLISCARRKMTAIFTYQMTA